MTTTPPCKVLIIDDDVAVTQTFASMLRLEGHEVRTALDAEAGLHQARIEHPDAIIVDLRMPLINGLGFLYRLRADARYQETPVAIVTGDYTVDAVARARGAWRQAALQATVARGSRRPDARPARRRALAAFAARARALSYRPIQYASFTRKMSSPGDRNSAPASRPSAKLPGLRESCC
jgi:CheY-like chemotaxis protein